VRARDAGRLTLRGAGAGGPATCSAVLGDVVALLRALGEGRDFPGRSRVRALAPAFEVRELFVPSARHSELARYPIWSDSLMTPREQVLANA